MPPSAIKILQLLVTMPVGGAEVMAADIATGLAPGRFEVITACLGEPGAMGEELSRQGKKVVSLGLDLKRAGAWSLVLGGSGHLSKKSGRISCTPISTMPISTAGWPRGDWGCPGWWPRCTISIPG